jgi:ApaG protein
MSSAFQATTSGITVTVRVFFLPEQSRPPASVFVWAYHITIQNGGERTMQLLSRRWEITDANGATQIVEGQGVVGETPVLEPGMSFDYTSGTPLGTSSGFMVGTYYMIDVETNEPFSIAVPAFALESPEPGARIH